MIQTWDHQQSIGRLTFVSDLHLFSNRSSAAEHHDLIARSIEESDLCVWGGDLFDFRWSRLRDETDSVDRAIDWLQQWYADYPDKHFVYLDGNHDAHLLFRQRLAHWADDRSRFQCGLDCLRVGDTLLLHGDVIEGGGTADAFADYRGRWQDKPMAGRLASGIYDVAVAARVHRAAALAAHRRRATCIRLIRWLHGQPSAAIEGIQRIVFGHTHRPIEGYRFQGLEFHNPGAAIRHVPFRPVKVESP